ncbi:MAG: hypothetical protein J0H34_21255 [Rhizobiales bacterium]|nr:hypothetical protein [Hyphomicrobiales bacterium]
MTRHGFLKTLFITTALISGSVHAAGAQDINAVGERLKQVLDAQGMKIDWASASGDASEMVLDGVTLSIASAPDKLPVGKVTLSNITEEDGGYKIGSVTLPDYNVTEDGATIDLKGVEMQGLKLGATNSTDPLANLLLYESADVANFSVAMEGKEVFGLKGMHAEMTPLAEGKPMEFKVSSDGFSADLSSVKDPQAKAAIDALGYQTISGNLEMEGSWQPSDGRMNISQYDITVDNAGTFGMTFDLSGYTPAFLKSLQELQKKMADQPAGADNSAQGMAMLGLMQQLTFNGASIRFDDDSLTNKVLDFVGKQQGISGADLANQVKGLTPIMVAQVIKDQELIKNVSEAVSTFLSEPKSLEINAQPAQPVPFALLAAGAMASPQDLPKTLGVTVTANED